MCSVYVSKKGKKSKKEFYLSRADGKRHFKKAYWTPGLVRNRTLAINRLVASMGTARSSAARKKLKGVLAERKAMASAKALLSVCVKSPSGARSGTFFKFDHVKPVIEQQCMSCHQVLGWENNQEFFLESARVEPGNLELSPLYSFLKNNPDEFQPATMPKDKPALSDARLLMLREWIEHVQRPAPTPPPGGEEGEGRALYASKCASCHGSIDTSAKWGKSGAAITAALGSNGIAQMRFLKLSAEEILKIALALSKVKPPAFGTLALRAIGPVAEGTWGESPKLLFEIKFTGKTPEPFKVGYVTSSGTALAGSDFVFSASTVQFSGTNGETKIIEVPIVGDSIQEADETLSVDIGGVSNGGVRVLTSTAQSTILNDDQFVQGVSAPVAEKVRFAYGFNGNFKDSRGLSDATVQSAATISSDAKVGSGALLLTEAADHLLVPSPNLQGMTDFTFGGWVYWQNATSTTSRVFDFGSSTTNYIYFSPRDSTNRCRFELRAPSGTYILNCPTNTPLPANQWVHLATTYNSTTHEMKIFINAKQVATTSSAVFVDLSTISLVDNKIGKSRVASQVDFAGRLDELAVWDAALSVEQIAEAMALAQSPRFDSGIQVLMNGRLISNGSTIDLGTVNVGESKDFSLFINNTGRAGLAFMSTPQALTSGIDSGDIKVTVQPWPWHQPVAPGSFTAILLHYAPSYSGDKRVTLVIPSSDPREGNFTAFVTAKAIGSGVIGGNDPGSSSPDLTQGKYLYAVNCASCHGALDRSTKSGITAARLSAAINPVTGNVKMRGLALTAQDIDRIVLALNSIAPPETDSSVASDSIINVGTANYVASTLNSIFLPDDATKFVADDTAIQLTISRNILGRGTGTQTVANRVRFFGGRCDRFDDNCQTEALPGLLRPVPNAIRAGLIQRTCDEILSVDRAVTNVAEKLQRSTTSAIDAGTTQAIYELFYPGRKLPVELADVIAIYTKGASQYKPIDHWRFQIHLMCASSDWEVL